MRSIMFLWALPFLMPLPAWGTNYVVNPDGSGDFPTIQAAVAAAVDGDVIELGNGTFTGEGNRNVDYLGKEITIQSQGGPGICIIDCQATPEEHHSAFILIGEEGPGAALAGVRVVNGARAVRCFTSSPTISNCVFEGNGLGLNCTEGAALWSHAGSPHISDCLFVNNAADQGGAVAVCNGMGDQAILERCTFINNQAELGGGLFI